jgi:predicted MFS family arabinose efflux permease
LGISIILLFNGWFKEKLTLIKVLFIQSILFFLIYLGIHYFENKWIIASLFILVTIVMWGFSSVKTHFFLNYLNRYKNKASYVSINSFIQKVIQAIFSLLMGYLVFHYDYKSAYLVFGLLILGVIIFYTIYSIFQSKKQSL